MKKNTRKNVGDKLNITEGKWSFGGKTPISFDNHIAKSVPHYTDGHDLILGLSHFFLNDKSVCYDIGCSTGTLINKLSRNLSYSTSYIGLDIEKKMINHAKNKNKNKNCKFVHSDIAKYKFKKADLFISYYTLQFVHPSIRQIIIDKIYDSLHWGGAFICFEKTRSPDARFQDITTSLYNDYKKSIGYSWDEIMNKSQSLKGVLEPFSTKGNLDLFKRSGFKDITTIFKYINFEGFLAIK